MSKPKKAQPTSNYITTVRNGAIGANIFRGNTADGFTYLYFELSRAWIKQSGNSEGYSKKFYDRNAEAMKNVIDQAAEWIEAHPEAADGPLKEAATQPPLQNAA